MISFLLLSSFDCAKFIAFQTCKSKRSLSGEVCGWRYTSEIYFYLVYLISIKVFTLTFKQDNFQYAYAIQNSTISVLKLYEILPKMKKTVPSLRNDS